MLTVIGVPLDKLSFVQGTEYQLSPKYTLDMYQMTAMTTTEHTAKAGAEVVKQTKNPLLSSLIYPILQALDEEYLGVDIQFGGVDQRKIFMFAREWLPKLGYKKRLHLMNTLIPGLTKSGKMSSSEPLSKIDFDESDQSIRDKFSQAYSVDGKVENNGLLALLKHILFRRMQSQDRKFLIKRPDIYGGDLLLEKYEEVESLFAAGKLASADLKSAVAEEVILLITPLRAAIEKHIDLMKRAYPPQEPSAESAESSTKTVTPTTAATIGSLDIRVAKIVEIAAHPQDPNLFEAKVDVGEAEPRTVLSDLGKWVPVESLKGKLVLVICNVQPRTIRKITTNASFLVANGEPEGPKNKIIPSVLFNIPEGSTPGERLAFNVPETIEPEITNKRLDRILSDTRVSDEGILTYASKLPFTTSKGQITCDRKDTGVH